MPDARNLIIVDNDARPAARLQHTEAHTRLFTAGQGLVIDQCDGKSGRVPSSVPRHTRVSTMRRVGDHHVHQAVGIYVRNPHAVVAAMLACAADGRPEDSCQAAVRLHGSSGT